jgi:hypothetical protein
MNCLTIHINQLLRSGMFVAICETKFRSSVGAKCLEKIEMNNNKLIKCHGCKAVIKNIDGPKHAYIGSDSGCWAVFCSVLAKEYTEYNELWRTHRLTVDTYAAQHPGNPGRKEIQSVFIHLTRLYLQLEKGLDGKRANAAMINISSYKEQYVWLDPVPDFTGIMNITHVAMAKNISEHKEAVELWAASVWQAWSKHHDTIKYFVEHNKILTFERRRPVYGK